ncbi:MAG: polysaccharide biosynthesis C-terminal domain-containing protein, partial [Proteobacteria bacterium]|nr:polysaccharide biosynthesis C-terminal domain-containing protein [Pseudomonadota bacterium]
MTVIYYALDLVKDLYLYGRFGPGQLDAFYGSYTILEAVLKAFAFSALGAVMMPTLARAAQDGSEELAERFASTALLLGVAVLSAVAVAGLIYAPQILSCVYGFAATPAAVTVARLVFAVLPLFAIEQVLRLTLEHRQQFGAPAAASVAARVMFLAVVFAFASAWGVAAAGAGSLAGAAAAAAVVAVFFFAAGARLRSPLPLSHKLVRRGAALLAPLWLAGLFAQATFVDRIFASRFGAGQLSLLRLAAVVTDIPVALFCVAIGTAVFPRLCRAAASGDRVTLKQELATALRRAHYFTLPAMFGFMVLARPMIRVVYQRGQFTANDAALAAGCLVAYAPALVALAMRPILDRALYAVNKHKYFLPLAAATLGLNILLNYLFGVVLGWGIVGLALSTTAVVSVTMTVLWLLAARFIGTGGMRGLVDALLKMAACAALMGLACAAAWRLIEPAGEPGRVFTAVRLAAVILFGAAFYFLSTAAAGLEEFGALRELAATLVKKLCRRNR